MAPFCSLSFDSLDVLLWGTRHWNEEKIWDIFRLNLGIETSVAIHERERERGRGKCTKKLWISHTLGREAISILSLHNNLRDFVLGKCRVTKLREGIKLLWGPLTGIPAHWHEIWNNIWTCRDCHLNKGSARKYVEAYNKQFSSVKDEKWKKNIFNRQKEGHAEPHLREVG